MHDSPRIRRLRNDLIALERLVTESSVIRFRAEGKPPQRYLITLQGRSLARDRGKVMVRDRHEVEIKLGSSYPRTMPEIRWLTPIYHPNISEIGMVCLGGYGTNWVPSLNLDELCVMLWDMARFHNYDIRSPYNREAALWVANQTSFKFPLDPRAMRDLRVALGRVDAESPPPNNPPVTSPEPARAEARPGTNPKPAQGNSFLRRFASEIQGLMAQTKEEGARPTPSDGTLETENNKGIVILDMEVDLRPRRPESPPREEIVFLD